MTAKEAWEEIKAHVEVCGESDDAICIGIIQAAITSALLANIPKGATVNPARPVSEAELKAMEYDEYRQWRDNQ